MVSFLKQGLGLKASAAKLYPNFPWVHPSGMMFFLRLVSLWTDAVVPTVGINTFTRLLRWLLRQLPRNTPSLSRSAMIYVWVSRPWVLLTTHYWSCHVGKIHIYLTLKIKNAIWEIKRDKFLKSKISWKSKCNTKTKKYFSFWSKTKYQNQRKQYKNQHKWIL